MQPFQHRLLHAPVQNIALTACSSDVGYQVLLWVAHSLNVQLQRDFLPMRGLNAKVTAFEAGEKLPEDYTCILVGDSLTEEIGYHEDAPYAAVLNGPNWSVAASRAALTMLVNPFGHSLVIAPSVISDQGMVEYLDEPCIWHDSTYSIGPFRMCNFTSSHFLRDHQAQPRRIYDALGVIEGPRKMPVGATLYWRLPSTQEWFVYHNGGIYKLGTLERHDTHWSRRGAVEPLREDQMVGIYHHGQ